MKKEILLLLGLIVIVFSIYSLIPVPSNQDEKIEKNFESPKITENKLEKTLLTFDVVRITNHGDAVIAGRSKPNDVIQLFDGEENLAEILADINGEWVWTSKSTLSPGLKRLYLKSFDQNGLELQSDQTIIIFLDKKNNKNPFVLKSSNNGFDQSLLLNLEQVSEGIILDLVEYSTSGNIMLSGRSEVNSSLSFFLDDKKVGEATSDEWGFWTFKSDDNMQYGKHNLRIDLLTENGVLSIFTPIFKEEMVNILESLKDKKIVVQPGNSLWRIARKTLGGGMFYSEIYKKNIVQISDPDLIFPGQVFQIPIITGKINYE